MIMSDIKLNERTLDGLEAEVDDQAKLGCKLESRVCDRKLIVGYESSKLLAKRFEAVQLMLCGAGSCTVDGREERFDNRQIYRPEPYIENWRSEFKLGITEARLQHMHFPVNTPPTGAVMIGPL